jgi:hypothetical protein
MYDYTVTLSLNEAGVRSTQSIQVKASDRDSAIVLATVKAVKAGLTPTGVRAVS